MLTQILIVLAVLVFTAVIYGVWYNRLLTFLLLLVAGAIYALLNFQLFVVIPVPPGCAAAFLLATVLLLLIPRRRRKPHLSG